MGETYCEELLNNHQASYLDPDKTKVNLLNSWLKSKNKTQIKTALRMINGNNLLKCNKIFVPSLIEAVAHFFKSDPSFSIYLWTYLNTLKKLGHKVAPAQQEKLSRLFPWSGGEVSIEEGKAYISGKGVKLSPNLTLDKGSVVFSNNRYFSAGDTIINGIVLNEGNTEITETYPEANSSKFLVIDIPNKSIRANSRITFTKGNPIVEIDKDIPLTISSQSFREGIKIKGGDSITNIELSPGCYSSTVNNGGFSMRYSRSDSSYSVKIKGSPLGRKDQPVPPMAIKIKEKPSKPAMLENDFEYLPRKCNTIKIGKKGGVEYVCSEPKMKKADYFKQQHPGIKLSGQTPRTDKLIQLVAALNNIDPRVKERITKITFTKNIKEACNSDNAAACIIALVTGKVDHKGRVLSKTLKEQEIFLSTRFGLFAFYHEVGHAIANILNLKGDVFTKDWVAATGDIHGKVAKQEDGKAVWVDNPKRKPSKGAHGCVRAYSCSSTSEDWADFYGKCMTDPKYYTKFKDPKHKARLDIASKYNIFTKKQLDVITSGKKPEWVAGYNVNEDPSLEDMLQSWRNLR